jgi:hypothetical protein
MSGKGWIVAVAIAVAPWGAAAAGEAGGMKIDQARIDAAVKAVVARHGSAAGERARQGVGQVAMFWRDADGTPGEFEAFCVEQFVADAGKIEDTLDRFEKAMEAIAGHQVALTRKLREPMELDMGPMLPVDVPMASLNPFDHFVEDAFKTRVAFIALLNFPLHLGEEWLKAAPGMDRAGLAAARLAQAFQMRVPGEVRVEASRTYTAANDYIDNYNIRMDHVVTGEGKRLFPDGLRLISHWGLRDHIKGLYSDPNGNLDAQRLILKVMERIIRQEIPAAAIDSDKVDWDPVANRVVPTGPEAKGWAASPREDDRRYAHLLSLFKAERAIDRWSPAYPTLIARKFGVDREIPEVEVEGLLKAVLADPIAKDVAALIRKRLGRDLEPFDIWYDGFKARGAIPEEKRDKAVRRKYKNLAAFQKDIPSILARLGFKATTAERVATRIAVDPARGAGHAMGAGMRGDLAHLRTRVPKGGMDYKGYNIAMHELGHTVEQTFTLYDVDRTLLAGVPNTAFTEAWAFVFQTRDLDLLGLSKPDSRSKALKAIDAYWMMFEIAGVGLLDIAVWHWMYDHPDATPAQLREAVVAKAIEIWNRYYSPVLGVKDSPVLAIYSHMICIGMYIPDYPLGHLIESQIEAAIEGKRLGAEMERMCVQGRVTPDQWMRAAVGAPLSAKPLIDAAAKAMKSL